MKALLFKLALFAGLLVLAMLTATDWRRLDHAVFARMLAPADAAHPDVRLVELPDLDPADSQSARLRAQLGQTLLDLARRRPAKVAIDIQIDARGGPLADVVQGLDALRAANVPVYLVIDPKATPEDLAPEVYGHGAVAAVGHSRLQLDGRMAYYQPLLRRSRGGVGKTYEFLPALLAGVPVEDLPAYQVFGTPPLASSSLGQSLAQLPEALREQIVIVASSDRECRMNRGGSNQALCRGAAGSHAWSGPELLVWALTDLLQRDKRRVLRPVYEPAWMLVAALACAGWATAAHALLLRRAGRSWSPTVLSRRLGAVSAAALAAALAALALAGWLLLQLGWLLPPTFALIAAAAAVLLCHWHARQRLVDTLAATDRRAADNQIAADVDVFISYSHAPGNGAWVEQEIVRPLQAMRLSDGRALRIFFDRNDITVGQQWFSRINLSILGSRCFLCVWSDDYMERDYCRWELEYAYPRAARADFLFLPVSRLAPQQLAAPAYAQYLQVRQCIDAAARPDFFEEIRQALQRHLDAAPAAG